MLDRAQQLLAGRRFKEVVDLLARHAEAQRSPAIWSMLAVAHLQLGEQDKAATALLHSATLDAEGGRAWLNAAMMLVESGRAAEALDAANRALALNFEQAAAHHIRGGALRGLGRYEEARDAFQAAITARADFPHAHRELAQLVWMATGDVAAATTALDRAIAAHPHSSGLHAERSRILYAAGDSEGAGDESLRMAQRLPDGPARRLAEANAAALSGDYAAVESTLRQGLSRGDDPLPIFEGLCEALLALGKAADLLRAAETWLTRAPLSQLAVAYYATALRMLGDPRSAGFQDYANLVRVYDIDCPPGWTQREGYISDLATRLRALHQFQTHPFDQSVRHGSQTMQSLVSLDDHTVKAFFQAIDRPIWDYLAALGGGDDPLRARNHGAYEIRGCWSVWLKSGGHHVDHVHPQGWISSACYIETPSVVNDETDRQGWIRFGRPPTQSPGGLDAELYVQPKPGRLVLFPAWMWHGTVPFTSDERRLSVAFDVLPG